METKKKRQYYRIALSVTACILSALSASFGYSFLSGMPWPFYARFLVGLLLMWSPLLVFFLAVELFRKE